MNYNIIWLKKRILKSDNLPPSSKSIPNLLFINYYYKTKAKEKFLRVSFKIFRERPHIIRASISVSIIHFLDCFFNTVAKKIPTAKTDYQTPINQLEPPESPNNNKQNPPKIKTTPKIPIKTSKKLAKPHFLDSESPGSRRFSAEESLRFVMDNLDEQILWLEERTLSGEREDFGMERERLLIRVVYKMFDAFESHVGELEALDVLCHKNLFSYVRLKNRTLSGENPILDSKFFLFYVSIKNLFYNKSLK